MRIAQPNAVLCVFCLFYLIFYISLCGFTYIAICMFISILYVFSYIGITVVACICLCTFYMYCYMYCYMYFHMYYECILIYILFVFFECLELKSLIKQIISWSSMEPKPLQTHIFCGNIEYDSLQLWSYKEPKPLQKEVFGAPRGLSN